MVHEDEDEASGATDTSRFEVSPGAGDAGADSALNDGASLAPSEERHVTRIVVWDTPAAVECGQRFAVRLGVACASRCTLADRRVEVRDHVGDRQATATLDPDPWTRTDALYHAEIAPRCPGDGRLLHLGGDADEIRDHRRHRGGGGRHRGDGRRRPDRRRRRDEETRGPAHAGQRPLRRPGRVEAGARPDGRRNGRGEREPARGCAGGCTPVPRRHGRTRRGGDARAARGSTGSSCRERAASPSASMAR